ncbi:hypothetical protein TEA_027994 [Camellia sinensis var. sinensis]|uniref:Uncharacterized protein n=1 Tax=Camellia sinensis var. sinensis TaxID=542762 RepID=A0A4S4E2N9_CAMSN|nr:hypothetical protein TEA_027994 [Camellia sinensis var. sinensis]
MEEKKYVARPMKRPSRDCENSERPTKRTSMEVVTINDDDDGGGGQRLYKFRLLLPNGMSLGLKIRDPQMEMSIEEFVELVKEEYFRAVRSQTNPQKPKRRINWKSNDLHFVDVFDNVMARKISFKNFMPHKYHILTLHDGSGEAETYENMWDLTPDTELLMELPAEYTFETALADLIDNSLQAVWSNGVNERRLISVELDDDRISIFDTGPGMDGSDENSIVKWKLEWALQMHADEVLVYVEQRSVQPNIKRSPDEDSAITFSSLWAIIFSSLGSLGSCGALCVPCLRFHGSVTDSMESWGHAEVISIFFVFCRGKMGASLHRSSRGQGIGGKPPYLTLGKLKFGIDLVNPRVTMFLRFSEATFAYASVQPFWVPYLMESYLSRFIGSTHLLLQFFPTWTDDYHPVPMMGSICGTAWGLVRFSDIALSPFFGMFGYGGPIASMHLGRHALVSSKTKESKKVYILCLEREALLCSSGSEKTWRTDGGIRHPTEDEIRSHQCSFTKNSFGGLLVRGKGWESPNIGRFSGGLWRVLNDWEMGELVYLLVCLYAISPVLAREMISYVGCAQNLALNLILNTDGPRGLYRGFGISILTYAPSNAVWWASYSVAQRLVWGGIGCYLCKKDSCRNENGGNSFRPDSKTVMAVQGMSAAMAGGVSALITMPLDTIKTRLQVLDGDENNNGRKGVPTMRQTVRNLVREGGWMACYRGLGPRWASMSIDRESAVARVEEEEAESLFRRGKRLGSDCLKKGVRRQVINFGGFHHYNEVEIFEPKMRGLDIAQLQCKLKDIYFPYIQVYAIFEICGISPKEKLQGMFLQFCYWISVFNKYEGSIFMVVAPSSNVLDLRILSGLPKRSGYESVVQAEVLPELNGNQPLMS